MSDDEQHNQTFEAAGAGASLTFPMQCSALRKNGHVVIKGRPCKIVDMSTSKTGKHGHAKVHLVAIDIFTNKKLEDISPSTHNMDVPNVTRNEYQLVNIEDGFLNLINMDGVAKDDVKTPEGDLGKDLQEQFDAGKDLYCTITSAMGEEMCLAFKEAPKFVTPLSLSLFMLSSFPLYIRPQSHLLFFPSTLAYLSSPTLYVDPCTLSSKILFLRTQEKEKNLDFVLDLLSLQPLFFLLF
ncbi:translation protein SH3-like domain-containing protein [Melampsora americana]|nr:translation protein SH3-like domain-containing protein [Melampsora americana]